MGLLGVAQANTSVSSSPESSCKEVYSYNAIHKCLLELTCFMVMSSSCFSSVLLLLFLLLFDSVLNLI
jgi:hypothetical protein